MSRHIGDPSKPLVFASYPRPVERYKTPLLVLGIVQREPGFQILFTDDREWHDLEWQGGGVDCSRHPRFTCTILTPRDEIREALVALNEKWVCSSLGSTIFGQLDQVLEYRDDIRAVGADCNRSYLDVAEAIYPMDLESGLLSRLCEDELPDDLTELVLAVGVAGRGDWIPEERAAHLFDDAWRVFCLGDNAD